MGTRRSPPTPRPDAHGRHPLSDPPPSEARTLLVQVGLALAALAAFVLLNVVLYRSCGYVLVPG